MRARRAAPAAAPAVAALGARRPLSTFVALNILVSVLVGTLVLVGFFAPVAGGLVQLFSRWTTTILVFALLLGFINVLRVHIGRLLTRQGGWPYSAALIVSAFAVIAAGVAGSGSVGDPTVQWIFNWIYQPIGSSLFALLTFLLASAAFRILRAGPSAAWVLLVVALLVISGSTRWSADPPLSYLADLKDWIMSYPALAGLRGIVLGAALGAVATSLRVLLGFDRPYMS